MSRKILVIAEHNGEKLNSATARAVSCAKAIGGEIHVGVFSDNPAPIAKEAASIAGIDRVLTIGRQENAYPLAALLAPQIKAMSKDYTHILAASSTFGKDLLPHVAALIGVPMITDIMEVLDPHAFKRPIYAGNVIVTVNAPDEGTIVASARAASWPICEAAETAATIENMPIDVPLPQHTRFIKLDAETSDRPDLQSAARVVSGGRGVGSKENFDIIYGLADKLGAAVGASRAAVDAGFVPNELQVGQTGKIIAPNLYIAVGISGAIQHLTGIKDAGTIVAINKDPDAPIFEVADVGLVGDLFKIVPELERELDNSR